VQASQEKAFAKGEVRDERSRKAKAKAKTNNIAKRPIFL
jgi:hypothetical protein